MKRLFIALALITANAPLMAQEYDDWYEVELILFENLDPYALESERWPEEPGAPEMDDLIELTPLPQIETAIAETEPGEPNAQAAETDSAGDNAAARVNNEEQPFQLLPKELFQLTEQYQKLEKSDAYRPLIHIAWRQIIHNRTHPDHIHIYTDMDAPRPVTDETETPAAPPIEQPLADAESASPNETSPSRQWQLDAEGNVINIPIGQMPMLEETKAKADPGPRLNGVLTLSRGRYIHLETDLLWRLADETVTADEELAETAPPGENLYALPQPFELTGEVSDTPEESAAVAEEEAVIKQLRIQGKLRTRSGETHYIDHPAIGMLVLFTPYAPPMNDENATPETAETFGMEE